MKTTEQLDAMYEQMLEIEICTADELELVTGINGYNEQTLNDIVYYKTAYQSLEAYLESSYSSN